MYQMGVIRPRGVTPLLDYVDADTFTRVEEAALVDPRAPGEGGTATEAWGFPDTGMTTPWENFSDDLDADWTHVNTPVQVTGISDPHGGTDAVNIEDNNAGATEGYQEDGLLTFKYGQRIRVSAYIGKDADETRFPEIQFKDNGNQQLYYVQINTNTGADNVRINNGVWSHASHVVASHDANWWKITVDLTDGTGTIRKMRLTVLPAAGLTLGSSSSSAVGAIDFFLDPIVTENAWKLSGERRILPDGAVLIEGARTNLVIRSQDLDDAAWAKLTQTPTVTKDAYTAPDGSPAGDKMLQLAAAGRSDVRSTTFAETDSVDYTGSIYLQAPEVGEAPADIVFRMRNKASADLAVVKNVAASWTRYEEVQNASTGGGSPFLGLQEEATGVEGKTFGFFGAQCEEGGFPSSPIRTRTAPATRDPDRMSYTSNTVLDTSTWSVSVVPHHGSANLLLNETAAIYARTSSDNAMSLRDSSGTKQFVFSVNAVEQITQTVSWTGGTTLTMVVDWTAREVTLSGFDTGNGTFAIGGTFDWSSAASSVLIVGALSTAGASSFFGTISQPV